MLFNSFEFLFIFLPILLILYYFIIAINKSIANKAIIYLLCIFSLLFYSYWKKEYFFLIMFSIIINFLLSKAILNFSRKKIFLIIGIIFNISLLSYFKYFNFIISNFNEFFYYNIHFKNIILPLAISFFTFQQIAFLVDCYRGLNAKYSFLNYILFVTFFPQLIAGPIVHHAQMMPQFAKLTIKKNLIFKNFLMGSSIFIIGLFKKIIFADNMALIVDPVYDANNLNLHLSVIESWIATLAYGLQIYFDFSGYSDMAIGLALIFGINLPRNFNSPYKSSSIIEFWKRWHITLSKFINEYLFNPIALFIARNTFISNSPLINNLSFIIIPAIITFCISGLWHGASWNFVIWGLMHGIYVVINSFFKFFDFNFVKNKSFSFFSIFLTFFFVNIAWVPFRANDFSSFKTIFKSLFGQESFISFPAKLYQYSYILDNLFFFTKVSYNGLEANIYYLQNINFFPIILIPISYFIIFFFKNSKDYFSENDFISCIKFDKFSATIIALAIILLLLLGNLNPSPFIYFNF